MEDVLAERSLRSAASADLPGSSVDETIALYGGLRLPLLRYLLSFGIANHDGEEIVQEAFLALFRHIGKGKPRTNINGWLFRVAHNLALKHLEQVKKHRVPFAGEAICMEAQPDSALNPEEQLIRIRRSRKLQSVLLALSDQDRQCICLRAEGLRYREIAEILGMSLGGVSVSLTRSLARFQRADQE